MRTLFKILCLSVFVFALSHTHAASANTGAIAAVVNEDAITVSDLNDRTTLIMRSSGMPESPEIRAKLTPQILANLIEEQIMLQEAERLELKVTEEQIEQGFGTLAQQNKVDPEQFKMMLERSGVNVNTMLNQIESQIAWGQAVQKTIRPRITVTDADIDDMRQRMRDKIGKTEYLLAGIFLPIDKPEDAANIREMSYALAADMRAGKVPFSRIAQQFSKAPGANQGGDMGWIQEGQQDQEIEKALAQLQPGQISDPVKSRSGYNIFLLREKRTITEETIPTDEALMQMIGTERLERMQRRRLQDLKSSAFIDVRV